MVLESPARSRPSILCWAEAGRVPIPRLCRLSTGSTKTQPGDAGWTGLHGASRPPHRAEGPCEVALHSPAGPASEQGDTGQEMSPGDGDGNQCCWGSEEGRALWSGLRFLSCTERHLEADSCRKGRMAAEKARAGARTALGHWSLGALREGTGVQRKVVGGPGGGEAGRASVTG